MSSPRTRRGSILVTLMWVTVILFLMMAVVGSSTIKALNDSRREGDTSRIRYAAFAGLQRALGELIQNPDWPGPAWPQRVPGTLLQNPNLGYTVEVYNNTRGTGPRTAAGVSVPVGAVYLVCEGADTEVSTSSRTFGGMAGTAVRDRPSFDQVALGDAAVSLTDSVTDAWDGARGLYDPTRLKPKEGSVASNGTMGLASNARVDGDVELQASVSVDSDGDGVADLVDTDGDGVPDSASAADPLTMDTTSSFTGVRKTMGAPKVVAPFVSPIPRTMATMNISAAALPTPAPPPPRPGPPPPPPVPTLLPGAYRNVTVEPGKTLKLRSGRYYVSETFVVNGGRLEVDASRGPVIVYVGEEMQILNRGEVNKLDSARNLQIYFTDEKVVTDPVSGLNVNKSLLTIDDSTGVFVAAGKKLEVVGTKAEVAGAMVGRLLSFAGQSKLHYDVSLKDQALGGQSTWTLEGVHDLVR